MTSVFPCSFERAFANEARGAGPMEVPLFRALQRTLHTLSAKFQIVEFHGSRSQVRFTPTKAWRPGAGRCELADLMIVTFQQRPKQWIRLTFLQAKSERSIVTELCAGQSHAFWANYEQWDLLSNRPRIACAASMQSLPSNILSDALLSSVGSFGFFYLNDQGDYQIHYAAGDCLTPALSSPRRNGRMIPSKKMPMRTNRGYCESAAECCSVGFAHALEKGLIGTPLERGTADDEYRRQTRAWLHSTIAAATATTRTNLVNDPPVDVAASLLRLLSDDDVDEPTAFPTKLPMLLMAIEDGSVLTR